MLMVIFGAGATYDSILNFAAEATREGRPPLARNLFDRTFDRYLVEHPECGTLLDELRGLEPDVDLENALENIQAAARGSALRRRQLFSLRYYLRDLLWDVCDIWQRQAPGYTNYHILLQRLELWREARNERIAFVSFNYDLMLEKAVRDELGRPLDSPAHYLHGDGFMVIKPHGSVNWVRVVRDDPKLNNERLPYRYVEDVLLDRAGKDSLGPEDEFHVIPAKTTYWTPGNRVGMPALTIPVLGKADFECPTEHVRALRQAIPEVTKLLIVGWRATERHFLSLWTQAERRGDLRVQIVNKTQGSAEATLAALNAAGVQEADYDPYNDGLSWYLGNRDILERFLAA